MKALARTLSLLVVFGATTIANAATPNTPIKHVIIVIQENRSPDNLFQDPNLISNGADIAQSGFCSKATPSTLIQLQPGALDACFDPDHSHSPAWERTYAAGKMDGACLNKVIPAPHCQVPKDPQYEYVDNSKGVIQPYFDIAEQYGFSNYMFQTNQGPSFPAHQFLLSGTSAPIFYNDPGDNNKYWEWFSAENPMHPKGDADRDNGCIADKGAFALEVDPSGSISKGYTPPAPVNSQGFPCYDHPTLTDLLDSQSLSWKYYPRRPAGLWTAPNGINHICGTTGYGGNCQGAEWQAHVFPSPVRPAKDKMAPVLEDIESCSLPAVSWVKSDGSWSDHPGASSGILGPSWVAALVNSIGKDTKCDKTGGKTGYWYDTVILILWDDWGGWYDHVLPYNSQSGGGYPNGTGQQYVYGFRVPLLVVSAYTKQVTAQGGYISGTPSQGGEVPPYIHDFGSILNFTEYALWQNGSSMGQIGPPQYPYADYFAPDGPTVCPQCPYSLADFFDFSQSPRVFKTIKAPHTAEYFEDFGTHAGDPAPSDPDNDAMDED